MKIIKYYIIILFLLDYIFCHMFIKNVTLISNNLTKYAYPRRSQYDPFYIKKRDNGNDKEIDYNMMSPLYDFDNKTYPCRGYKRNNEKLHVVYKNNKIIINFNETNNILDLHKGGVLQQYSIALEKNNYENFTVIKNISKKETFESWRNNNFSTEINIPNIKTDNIILSWSWFSNHLSDKVEFFMNCIDLRLENDDVTDNFDNNNNIIIPCKIKDDNIKKYCNYNK